MKNIIKFTTLVFIIISLYSVSLFAQWEVNIDNDLMFIMNFDDKNESALGVGVDTSIADNWASAYGNAQISVVLFYSEKIMPENDLYLRIKKKSNNYIKYSISDEDISDTVRFDESVFICIGANTFDGIRSNNLIKILLDSSLVELYSNDELLGSYKMEGLKEVLEENIGNTEWYNKKIKN